ncbi:hypothetical protein [Streptomyces sp. UG1]|uniref:hypothetical protein n=1 Tax=Streptomyces sp. UG1 TaxID=3417652 RepID=UPI003CF3A1E2
MPTQHQPPAASDSVPKPPSRSGDRDAHLVETVPGVHAWVRPDGTWWLNNAGAVLGQDGGVPIDTCATAQRTRAFLTAVDEASSGAPLLAAVTTHAHGDALLPPTVPIIAHPETRETILQDTVLTSLPPISAPAAAGPRGDTGVGCVRAGGGRDRAATHVSDAVCGGTPRPTGDSPLLTAKSCHLEH